MTVQTLRALSEKFRKQTEDGINAMLKGNLDANAELETLIALLDENDTELGDESEVAE